MVKNGKFNKGYVNDAVPPEPGEKRFIVTSKVFWEWHEGVRDRRKNVGTLLRDDK